MIIFNATQARTNSMNNNQGVRKVMDVIKGYIQRATDEGKFVVEASFDNSKLTGGEAEFVKRYFEALGYTCSYTYDAEKMKLGSL